MEVGQVTPTPSLSNPGHLPWKGDGLRFTNLRSSLAVAWIASFRALPFMATYGRKGRSSLGPRFSPELRVSKAPRNESSETRFSASAAPFLETGPDS